MNRTRSPFAHIEMATKPRYVLSLDLGQKADYSALALSRVLPSPESTPEMNLDLIQVVGLRRYELRTPYPTIVSKVKETLINASLHYDPELGELLRPTLLIDATGVGAATVDVFLATEMGANMVPVTITSGREAREGRWNDTATPAWYVPKIDLVSCVMTMLESAPQRIQVAGQIPFAEILMAEMLNFKCKTTLAGNIQYEAGGVGIEGHRDGANDDLLLATSLVCWWIGRRKTDNTVRRGPNPFADWRG